MYIAIDDREEEHSFPEEINADPSIKPEEGSLRETYQYIKDFIKEHKKPIHIDINWNERRQELLDNTIFPQSLIDIIASYEVTTTQKNFLNLKNWFQIYEHSNRIITTTRNSIFLNLSWSSLMALYLTGSLGDETNKTRCQTVLQELSWMNLLWLFIGITISMFCIFAANKRPGFGGRIPLLEDLRQYLSVDLNKVTNDHLYKSLTTRETLLQRSTSPDSRFFQFTLLGLTPLTSLICISGFNCHPQAKGVEGTLLGANTLSMGLAAFGLYKNRQRNKLGQQQLNILTNNLNDI